MPVVTCLNCEKSFNKKPAEIRRSPRHFCCRSCSCTFQNKEKPRRKVAPRKCKRCGKDYTPPKDKLCTVLCASCRPAYRTRKEAEVVTLGECANHLSVKGKHPSWKWAYVRTLNRTWNAHLKRKCAVCGYDIHVELCHRKPISSFPSTATLGEVNAESNVVVLCSNHHWEFDHGLLTF